MIIKLTFKVCTFNTIKSSFHLIKKSRDQFNALLWFLKFLYNLKSKRASPGLIPFYIHGILLKYILNTIHKCSKVTKPANSGADILTSLQGNIKVQWYIIHIKDTDLLVELSIILVCSWNNKYHSWLVPKASISKAKCPKSYLIKLFNMLFYK